MLTAAKLLAKSGKALNAADQIQIQIQVKGTGPDQGQQVAIDYSFAKTNSSGSITIIGQKFELLAVDKVVYFRAPDSFWKQFAGPNAAVVQKVHGAAGRRRDRLQQTRRLRVISPIRSVALSGYGPDTGG